MHPEASASEDRAGEIQIGLLGPVEVRRGGVVLDLGGPQQRAVIAHLALDAGRVVAVDRLIQKLWGDNPPGAPLGALQSYVSRLRRALEPGRTAGAQATVLVSEAPGYALRVSADDVDVGRFNALAAAAREAAAIDHHEQALERFDLALSLWRGPALAGLGPDEEVGPLVVRLDEERSNVVGDRFDSMLALGRHVESVGALQHAVAEHPLRERLWAQLALALYRSRRQADALRALTTARETLVEELGLDPGPELRELESRLLAQDPSLLATPPAPAPAGRRVVVEERPAPVVTVVGRTAEWERVLEALDLAAAGRAGLLLLEGDPGIGKTTILEALAGEASASGWRVAVGRCAEPGLAPALWPWIEVVRSVSAAAAADGDLAGAGADEVHHWTSTLPAMMSAATSTESLPLSAVELADRLATLLRDDAAVAPRLLVLDDLHWADEISLDLVAMVLERVADAPLLIAAGHRPPELVAETPFANALGVLTRVPGLSRVRLSGLGADDVARLMSIIGGAEPSHDVAERVQQRTGGNPLFVAELARLAGFAGVTDDDVVPDAVRDVVRRRLAQLPPVTNDVLSTAAVLGELIDLRVLAEAIGERLDECLDAIDPAIAIRVLVPGESGTFRFAHALVRDAVLAELSALRLARLHVKAADAIERVHGADADHAEPIAWHRHAAAAVDDPARVAVALTLAGDVARVRSAFDRADVLLDLALEAARRVPAGPRRVALEVSALESLLSVSTQRSFMGVGLDEIAARIDDVAERNNSDHARQLALFTRWSKINAVGPVATGRYATAALELAERSNEPYVVVVGRYVAGSQCWLSGRNDAGRDHFALALAMREQADRSDPPIRIPVISVYGMAAIAAQLSGADSEADALLRTQRRLLALRPDSEVDMAFMQGIVQAVRGDAAVTLATTAFTVEPSPPSWMPHFSASCRVLHTWAAVELGAGGPEASAAVELGGAALEELDAGPTSIGVPAFRTFFGAALLKLGLPDALSELRTARRDAEATGDRWWLPETIRLLAEAEAAFGDAAAAPALLDEAQALAEQQGTHVVLSRVDASRRALDPSPSR
ncbi:MAG TPA: BTAD domain-containing putative transcriptional regulator [Ilumatobacteraceae bacterium]|nr:BTAD domain-containing putative transcriptional regulator [Ilumatobacteraceae bacterium]